MYSWINGDIERYSLICILFVILFYLMGRSAFKKPSSNKRKIVVDHDNIDLCYQGIILDLGSIPSKEAQGSFVSLI
jgi:hypothetical protein